MNFLGRIKLLFEYFKKKDMTLREFAIGMNSEVSIKKDLHILFFDYDEVTQEEAEESICECQDFWNLSDCFLYKTSNGFHAYFYYDIMPYTRVRMIIDFAKYVDPMFKFIGRFYDYKTIRQAGKYKVQDISFLKVLQGRRMPTFKEAELGDLKRQEREYLSQMHGILKPEALKDKKVPE
jgi:hypothetical protein